MPPDDFQDAEAKAAILKRRAFFVSSALTGVVAASALTGCPPDSQHPSGTTQTAKPVVSVPQPDVTPAPAPSSASPSDPPVKPSPDVNVPSLAVPDDVSDVAKRHFQRLADLVPKIHRELDAADKLSRSLCDIDDAACEGTWSQLANHLGAADDSERDLAARCGGTSADAKRFEASLAEHQRVIDERQRVIQSRIDAVLSDGAEKQKWDVHLKAAAKPRPCLRFACADW